MSILSFIVDVGYLFKEKFWQLGIYKEQQNTYDLRIFSINSPDWLWMDPEPPTKLGKDNGCCGGELLQVRGRTFNNDFKIFYLPLNCTSDRSLWDAML